MLLIPQSGHSVLYRFISYKRFQHVPHGPDSDQLEPIDLSDGFYAGPGQDHSLKAQLLSLPDSQRSLADGTDLPGQAHFAEDQRLRIDYNILEGRNGSSSL